MRTYPNNGSDSFCFRLRQAGWWNSLKIQKLRDWPEFDLIRPAGANRLIVAFKTVRTIAEMISIHDD